MNSDEIHEWLSMNLRDSD